MKELYGAIKAAAEGLGHLSLMKDWGFDMQGKVFADASAALGIISRQGLGKVRHIDTSYLWIQQVNAEKQLSFDKVPGESNIADLMTKDLDSATINKHCASTGLVFREGRSAVASELQHLGNKVSEREFPERSLCNEVCKANYFEV